MFSKKSLTIIVMTSFVGILAIIYCIGITDQGHTFIHGLIFGNDQVYFHRSVYSNPKTMTADDVNKELIQKISSGEQELISTGESVIGLPVYETPYSIDQYKEDNNNYNVLFLKKPNGDFLVYYLQKKRE